MYDVAIIGGGVVGAMTARELSRFNLKICILEKENDVAMGSTKANSAIVHAGFDAKEGSLKAQLNVRGAELMPKICRELNVDYKNNGALVIGYNDTDKIALEDLKVRGIKNGVKGLEVIDQTRLRKLEPNISDRATCALFAPTSAIVCPYDLTIAAIGNAMDNGAELKLNFNVDSIKKSNNIYTITSNEGESIKAKTVVNAAGLYTDEIAKLIGDNSFTISPRQGEYMLMDKEQGELVTHTIFTAPTKMGKGILVSPTVDGNLIVGPTAVNINDKTNKNTTPDGMSSVRTKSQDMVKNIDYRSVITSFTGLRAAGDTGDFIINAPTPGFINVAGIESPGLSASPAIAEYVVELLEKNGLSFSTNKNYISTRKSYKHFMELPDEQKDEIIKNDPSFGKICCRCENVTEGEILYALRANPKPTDLDGIKRRTRAQMGRCQGGFCSPHIMKLIADEMNISLESITKSGKNSYIVSHKIKEAKKND